MCDDPTCTHCNASPEKKKAMEATQVLLMDTLAKASTLAFQTFPDDPNMRKTVCVSLICWMWAIFFEADQKGCAKHTQYVGREILSDHSLFPDNFFLDARFSTFKEILSKNGTSFLENLTPPHE